MGLRCSLVFLSLSALVFLFVSLGLETADSDARYNLREIQDYCKASVDDGESTTCGRQCFYFHCTECLQCCSDWDNTCTRYATKWDTCWRTCEQQCNCREVSWCEENGFFGEDCAEPERKVEKCDTCQVPCLPYACNPQWDETNCLVRRGSDTCKTFSDCALPACMTSDEGCSPDLGCTSNGYCPPVSGCLYNEHPYVPFETGWEDPNYVQGSCSSDYTTLAGLPRVCGVAESKGRVTGTDRLPHLGDPLNFGFRPSNLPVMPDTSDSYTYDSMPDLPLHKGSSPYPHPQMVYPGDRPTLVPQPPPTPKPAPILVSTPTPVLPPPKFPTSTPFPTHTPFPWPTLDAVVESTPYWAYRADFDGRLCLYGSPSVTKEGSRQDTQSAYPGASSRGYLETSSCLQWEAAVYGQEGSSSNWHLREDTMSVPNVAQLLVLERQGPTPPVDCVITKQGGISYPTSTPGPTPTLGPISLLGTPIPVHSYPAPNRDAEQYSYQYDPRSPFSTPTNAVPTSTPHPTPPPPPLPTPTPGPSPTPVDPSRIAYPAPPPLSAEDALALTQQPLPEFPAYDSRGLDPPLRVTINRVWDAPLREDGCSAAGSVIDVIASGGFVPLRDHENQPAFDVTTGEPIGHQLDYWIRYWPLGSYGQYLKVIPESLSHEQAWSRAPYEPVPGRPSGPPSGWPGLESDRADDYPFPPNFGPGQGSRLIPFRPLRENVRRAGPGAGYLPGAERLDFGNYIGVVAIQVAVENPDYVEGHLGQFFPSLAGGNSDLLYAEDPWEPYIYSEAFWFSVGGSMHPKCFGNVDAE